MAFLDNAQEQEETKRGGNLTGARCLGLLQPSARTILRQDPNQDPDLQPEVAEEDMTHRGLPHRVQKGQGLGHHRCRDRMRAIRNRWIVQAARGAKAVVVMCVDSPPPKCQVYQAATSRAIASDLRRVLRRARRLPCQGKKDHAKEVFLALAGRIRAP